MLICIETHITCDFPGVPDPLSLPLDPHLGCDIKGYPKIDTVNIQCRTIISSPAKHHLNGVSLAG